MTLLNEAVQLALRLGVELPFERWGGALHPARSFCLDWDVPFYFSALLPSFVPAPGHTLSRCLGWWKLEVTAPEVPPHFALWATYPGNNRSPIQDEVSALRAVGLEGIGLRYRGITDDEFEALGEWEELRYVALEFCSRATPGAFERFPLGLRGLQLADCEQMEFADFHSLERFPLLSWLSVSEVHASILDVAGRLPALTRLHASNLAATEADVAALAGASQLRFLHLSVRDLGCRALLPLAELPRLRQLELDLGRTTNEELRVLEAFEQLEEIHLNPGLSVRATPTRLVGLAAALPKLRRLGLQAASRWGWSPAEWEALRAQLPARVQLVE
ncbi:MAG: hypothetical protein KDD82_28930 [Planctomycetes bacterium]|nr:hypothetical protein [Planctomycetota bacterium]